VNGLLDNGFSELATGFAGLAQTFFELVAEGHEFIDFLDDAVLFLQRRGWDKKF
jgi:hypothetical protein